MEDFFVIFMLSPEIRWAVIVGVLLLATTMFLALQAGAPVEAGKRNWGSLLDDAAGGRRILLVLGAGALVVWLVVHLFTSGSHGYCGKAQRYPTDEEFVREALSGNMRLITSTSEVGDQAERDRLVSGFLARNPDCCKVFREYDSELDRTSWLLWNNGVVVRARDEETLKALRRGERMVIVPTYYARVDNCLEGSKVIDELIPGG